MKIPVAVEVEPVVVGVEPGNLQSVNFSKKEPSRQYIFCYAKDIKEAPSLHFSLQIIACLQLIFPQDKINLT